MADWETAPSSSGGWETAPAVTTEEVNAAGLKAIGEAIPQPVKDVTGKVGEVVVSGWEAAPEPVKKIGRSTGNFLLDAIKRATIIIST